MILLITVFTRGVARNLIYANYSELHMIPLIASFTHNTHIYWFMLHYARDA
jgi:hypothetical protein